VDLRTDLREASSLRGRREVERVKRKTQVLTDLLGSTTCTSIHSMRLSEGKEREKGGDGILEE
jgi:hypothetical protein